MGIKNLLKSADILGPPISLTLNGSETVKTMSGSMLTICFVGATIAAICYFLIQFFDRSNPTITERVVRSKQLLPNNFGEAKMLPIYFIRNDEFALVDVDIAIKAIYAEILVDVGKKVDGVYKEYQLTYQQAPCRDLLADPELLDYFTDAENYPDIKSDILKYGVCLKVPSKEAHLLLNENPNGSLAPEPKPDYSTLLFRISPCNYNTYADCQTKAVLTEGQGTIDLVLPTYVLELQNDMRPVTKYFDMENAESITDFKNFIIKRYLPTESRVENESQYFGETEIVSSFISLEPYTSEIITRRTDPDNPDQTLVDCGIVKFACQAFLTFTFHPNRKENRYNRRYQQVPDLLSEIGGISSLLLQVFGFVNGIILSIIKNNIFISRLFPMLPIKALSCRKKNRYPDIVHEKDQHLDEHINFWDDLRDDAVEMVESSIDLSVLFKEICAIRVIANLLLDDKQKEMITLASFYEFRIKKQQEEEEKSSGKSKLGTNPQSRIQRERMSRAKAIADIVRRKKISDQTASNKTKLPDDLSRQIDDRIIEAFEKLKIDTFKIGDQTLKEMTLQDGFHRNFAIDPEELQLGHQNSSPQDPNNGDQPLEAQNSPFTQKQAEHPVSINTEIAELKNQKTKKDNDDMDERKI